MVAHADKLAANPDKFDYLPKSLKPLVQLTDTWKELHGDDQIHETIRPEPTCRPPAIRVPTQKQTSSEQVGCKRSRDMVSDEIEKDLFGEGGEDGEEEEEAADSEEHTDGGSGEDSVDKALHKVFAESAPKTPPATTIPTTTTDVPDKPKAVRLTKAKAVARGETFVEEDGNDSDCICMGCTCPKCMPPKATVPATKAKVPTANTTDNSSDEARLAPTPPATRGAQRSKAGKAALKGAKKKQEQSNKKAVSTPKFMRQGPDPTTTENEVKLVAPFTKEERKPAKNRKGEWYLLQAPHAEGTRYTLWHNYAVCVHHIWKCHCLGPRYPFADMHV